MRDEEGMKGGTGTLSSVISHVSSNRFSGDVEPPRHWRPEVPQELDAVCMKCLEQEPGERYPSAAALAEDLRRYRGREVLSIDDLDEPVQQERWARRAGYEILENLGTGWAGFTYKARRVDLEQIVVLERLSARHRFDPIAKRRFRAEAHLLHHLRHPNIVKLLDQGEQNDLSFFAREFVEGPSLAEKVSQAAVDTNVAAELVENLAQTIQHAHERRIVHGGLHPGRIHLTVVGIPKITSLRRTWLPRNVTEEQPTVGRAYHPAAYLAPEQLEGRRRPLAPSIDVYALGAILYTQLTGHAPFVARTLAELLDQVRTKSPVPPRSINASVPAYLEATCMKCLEKDPMLRPASAETLANELGQERQKQSKRKT